MTPDRMREWVTTLACAAALVCIILWLAGCAAGQATVSRGDTTCSVKGVSLGFGALGFGLEQPTPPVEVRATDEGLLLTTPEETPENPCPAIQGGPLSAGASNALGSILGVLGGLF